MYEMTISKIGLSILNFFKVILPNFISANFEITKTKRSKIIGTIIGAATLLLTVLRVESFTALETSNKWLLLAVVLMCPFVLAFFTVYTIRIKNDLFNKIWHFVFLLFLCSA